ncbi:MAG: hypothetical protein E6J90_14130 [Deltaproteobacteria bacterium]|nr:MAG: hypothetical protein E6J91_42970 [Deltaproteobacteria bacterium]TMQ21473.1 MAG: hypothetical protein E6J90_14130 [Deltaproteobacteria bacterium]
MVATQSRRHRSGHRRGRDPLRPGAQAAQQGVRDARPTTDRPHLPNLGDSDAVAAWRVRMGTDDAKQIYKQRAATAETVNADARAHRGMATTALRGLDKVTGSACRFALTYNILRFLTVSA